MPVPKLRFTDDQGQNYPVWTIKPLKDVTNRIIVGLATSVTPYYRKNGVPILRNLNIKENRLDDSDLLYLDEAYAAKQSNKKIHTGDVLTVHTGYVGISCLVPPKYDNCQTFTTLITTINSAILNNRFFCQYINSPLGLSRVYKVITSGGRSNLNTGDFVNFPTPISSLPEQGKIADFLTIYDHMIDVQAKRVEAMKTRKKGLLQKIFSQEIRFKNDQGQDYPEWEKVTLGNVMDNFSYGMNAAAKKYDGVNKYLRITDIDEQSHKYRHDSYVSPNAKLQDKYILQCGDICFARTGASVGKTYIYDKNDGKVYYAGFLIKGHVKTLYNAYFIYLNTLTDRYAKWVQIMSARTGQPGINMEEYKTYKIHCPSLPEQQKIADFLTAVDAQIEVEEKRLETMKTIKKGLLQQMFI